jgi:hypothetical protein
MNEPRRVLTLEDLAYIAATMLNCDWGRRISTRAHPDPCPAQMTQRIVLHDGDGFVPTVVQLCDPHAEFVGMESIPRLAREPDHCGLCGSTDCPGGFGPGTCVPELESDVHP